MIDSILHLYMSNEEYIEYRMVNVCSCRLTVCIASNKERSTEYHSVAWWTPICACWRGSLLSAVIPSWQKIFVQRGHTDTKRSKMFPFWLEFTPFYESYVPLMRPKRVPFHAKFNANNTFSHNLHKMLLLQQLMNFLFVMKLSSYLQGSNIYKS
jgi:hypothetical protein